jgi:hypothetical protein
MAQTDTIAIGAEPACLVVGNAQSRAKAHGVSGSDRE